MRFPVTIGEVRQLRLKILREDPLNKPPYTYRRNASLLINKEVPYATCFSPPPVLPTYVYHSDSESDSDSESEVSPPPLPSVELFNSEKQIDLYGLGIFIYYCMTKGYIPCTKDKHMKCRYVCRGRGYKVDSSKLDDYPVIRELVDNLVNGVATAGDAVRILSEY